MNSLSIRPASTTLAAMYDDLRLLASLAMRATQDSVQSFIHCDVDLARQIGPNDIILNHVRLNLEEACYYSMTRLGEPNGQPTSRQLIGVVSVATNLERIGDHAAQIAIRSLGLARHSPGSYPIPTAIGQMADVACEMIGSAVEAFTAGNDLLAERTVRRDREIDELHEHVYQELAYYMSGSPAAVEAIILLLWISHNLERIGDRASNICERAIYVTTGELKEFH